jgi:hypothetical protein
MRICHQSRSIEQSDALTELMLQAWQECGEIEIARYYSTYLNTPPFNRFSVTASNIHGFTPDQNAHRNQAIEIGSVTDLVLAKASKYLLESFAPFEFPQ